MLLRRVVLLVSGIPNPRGKAIKTDPIDAGYLVNRDSSHHPDSGSKALRYVSVIRLRIMAAQKLPMFGKFY